MPTNPPSPPPAVVVPTERDRERETVARLIYHAGINRIPQFTVESIALALTTAHRDGEREGRRGMRDEAARAARNFASHLLRKAGEVLAEGSGLMVNIYNSQADVAKSVAHAIRALPDEPPAASGGERE